MYSIFYEIQNRTGLQGPPPLIFYGTVRLFPELFLSPKGPHLKFFDILQQSEVSKNPKDLPFLLFRHYETQNCHFSFFFFEIFLNVSKKVPPFIILKTLRFLSLKYSADFRRSRLVFQLGGLKSDLHCFSFFFKKDTNVMKVVGRAAETPVEPVVTVLGSEARGRGSILGWVLFFVKIFHSCMSSK